MATTSGVIQRLKWVVGSRAVLVSIGPTPAAVQLFLLMFDDSDLNVLAGRRSIAYLLAAAQRAGLAVSLFHDTGQALITGVDVCVAPVRVDCAEVVQSVQHLVNLVPQIAGKTTVVRLYLSSRLPAVTTVTGVLRIRHAGQAAVFVPSTNQVALNPAQFGQIDVKRNTITNSLNFILPAAQTVVGTLEISLASLTNVATGADLTVSPPGALDTVQFINSPPLRLGLIAFSYDFGTPSTTRTPSTTEMGMIISWLGRAYPVAEVQAFQRVVTANAAVPFTCGDINSQLAAIRALDVSGGVDGRTHYYGVVSDSGFFLRGCAGVPTSPDPGAVGSGPTGPGTWGWDFDGCYGDWYAGHEIGHTFGRKHPGFCGETNDDAQYPFDNGQLSDADGVYAGLDVGDATFGLPLTALPGTVWHDVMTYCNRQWLSSYTYLGIRQRLVDEDALSFGAGAGAGRPDERFPEDSAARSVQPPQRRALISIVAEINLARNAGRISYVNPVERGPLSAEDAGSPVVLVFKSTDGRPLGKFRSPMQIFAIEATDEDRHALCNVIVAPDPSTSIIELYVHDQLADTFKPDPTLPALEPIALKVEQDAVVVSYGQSAALGAGHSYSVQISDDSGRSWQTIGVGLTSPLVRFDKDRLPQDRRLLVRVRATNGFRMVQSVVDLLP